MRSGIVHDNPEGPPGRISRPQIAEMATALEFNVSGSLWDAAQPCRGRALRVARGARYNEVLIGLHWKQSRDCGTASVAFGAFLRGAERARGDPASGKR